ncbi:sulfatase [Haloarchaeobius iranensis]|uniref:Arylsulfatase A n=1 Tax=Haloarchaeobius iranensis TaxID=996166 RepID=A0A1H0BUC4_9EURY|nr:sulfatase [Haloarchaeobius iranensis]SDN49254.1 Arylsulfatase A [Haloarchaeobius iranensis]
MTSIALVVLDTLRKDAFDEHFDWLEGVRFERAYSTANWTVPAHGSLFTGLYPSETGVHAKNMYLDVESPVLTELLRNEGYETRAFSANTNVTSHFDFDRGFSDFRVPDRFEHMNDDSVFDWREYSRTTETTGLEKYLGGIKRCVSEDVDTLRSIKTGLELKLSSGDGVEYGGAEEAMAQFEDESFGEDEFLFLNLMETHEPYRVPESYASVPEPEMTDAVGDLQLGGENGQQVVAAYEDCARYLSDIYAELYDTVLAEFDYVITLSDHGELLGEYGGWGHEYGVYPELTHVPLIISGPELDDETRTEAVSLVDVYRTILELVGINDSEGRGENLLEDIEGDRLTEYRGLTSWSEGRLRDSFDDEIVDTYDTVRRGIATDEGYCFETRDGVEIDSDEILTQEFCRDSISDFVAKLDERSVDGQAEVPEEVKDRLEDLGYA